MSSETLEQFALQPKNNSKYPVLIAQKTKDKI